MTKAVLAGGSEEFSTIESEGEMIARVGRELMGRRGIIVINDEAHHCCRHKVRGEEEQEQRLGADEKAEAKKNEEAARIWISGLNGDICRTTSFASISAGRDTQSRGGNQRIPAPRQAGEDRHHGAAVGAGHQQPWRLRALGVR